MNRIELQVALHQNDFYNYQMITPNPCIIPFPLKQIPLYDVFFIGEW